MKPKILLIEVSGIKRETLNKRFVYLDCQEIIANSSEEAQGYFRKGGRPDVIVLVFKLPGLSGPKFYEDIVLTPEWQNIAVVPFISRSSGKEEDPTLMGQWLAGVEVMEKVIHKETIPIVAKGEQGEIVTKVPPELILRVGEALLRKSKPLLASFRQARPLLIK